MIKPERIRINNFGEGAFHLKNLRRLQLVNELEDIYLGCCGDIIGSQCCSFADVNFQNP